jgi:hypothetical protein
MILTGVNLNFQSSKFKQEREGGFFTADVKFLTTNEREWTLMKKEFNHGKHGKHGMKICVMGSIQSSKFKQEREGGFFTADVKFLTTNEREWTLMKKEFNHGKHGIHGMKICVMGSIVDATANVW